VVAIVAGLMLRPYVVMFSARAASGTGEMRAVGGPLWLPIVLLVLLIVMLVVTWSWWRSQGRV
jgi:hypothetical protein